MSNIYITEPNTEGKVLLHTTFGDMDVELWPQQAPKACRNFVQLCLEGYYDDTIFHRIIAGFMVQGGDPTGTGSGGESVFPGGAFADEFHSRLRFTHRGLLAMANENKPNSNHSQFFFTLDACEFLDRKHTIFGKITGNTIFNLLSVGDVDTDAQDRPLHPPKLLSAEVLWNPFDDVVPRDIHHKRARSSGDTAEDAAAKKKRERKATKDLKLLSFGDEEEEFQQELTKKKSKSAKKLMSSHDLLDDKKLNARVDEELLQKIAETATASSSVDLPSAGATSSSAKKEAARASLKAAVAAASVAGKRKAASEEEEEEEDTSERVGDKSAGGDRQEEAVAVSAAKNEKKARRAAADEQDEYTRLREELRASKKAAPVLMGSKAKEQDAAKAFHDMLTPLQQQRQKYLQKKKANSRSGRQEETLQKLKQFQATLESANRSRSGADGDAGSRDKNGEAYHGQILDDDSDKSDDGGDGAGEDLSWMTAKLKFKKHIDDQFRAGGADPSTDDYTTIDTRDESAAGKRSHRQQQQQPPQQPQRHAGRSERRRSRSRSRGRREHDGHRASRHR